MREQRSLGNYEKDSEPQRARVLVVDDDERNLFALTEILGDLAEVVTASSGQAALRHLLNGDFAVILLDVLMPGMDGYETAQLIRERKQTSRIPIIFLSAINKETEHLLRGYEMGAVDYVFKPVDTVVLKSKVSVFVDLYTMRLQIEEQSRIQQLLLSENHRVELDRLTMARELQRALGRQSAILDALPLATYESALRPGGSPSRRFIGGDLARLTGFTAEQFSADSSLFFSRVHPEDRVRVEAFAGAPSIDARTCEYRWQAADGKIRHFLEQRAALETDGAALEWAGTLVDVSEQKALEARLLQSGKLDALGQLTGGIAHDFNNLLASITGGIDLLLRRVSFEDSEKRIVDLMRHAAGQGANLVRRMMAFARQQDLKPSLVSARGICESVAGLVEHAMGGTVTLEWNCPTDVGDLFVDQAQLELALVNLILNARDAMPKGGRVSVDVRQQGADEILDCAQVPSGDHVIFSVADCGDGIPSELLEKVTEPFFTTKSVGKGTGLGLSMVFGFANQTGGALRIISEVGCGTTVHLVLPRNFDNNEFSDEAAPHLGDTLDVQSVILVDDDESVRTIIAEELRDNGIDVECYEDGTSALARIRDAPSRFDLLMTDFAMPGLNGVETITEAKKLASGMKVILMTGYADLDLLATLDVNVPIVRKPLDRLKISDLLTNRAIQRPERGA